MLILLHIVDTLSCRWQDRSLEAVDAAVAGASMMCCMLLLSGFMSFIEQQTLQHICDGSEAAGLPEWDDFKADLQAGLIHFPSMRTPFLFAGECWSSLSNYASNWNDPAQLKIDGSVFGH